MSDIDLTAIDAAALRELRARVDEECRRRGIGDEEPDEFHETIVALMSTPPQFKILTEDNATLLAGIDLGGKLYKDGESFTVQYTLTPDGELTDAKVVNKKSPPPSEG